MIPLPRARALLTAAALVAGHAAGGCGSDAAAVAGGGEGGATPGTCPGGRDASGACALVVFEGDCAPGTAPRVGLATCAPVGPTCGEGFAPATEGWGCVPLLPAEPCTGATRAALGRTTCTPVGGDCDAPFPPPGATHLVSTRFVTDPAQRRYRNIHEAVTDAPAGAVIAIDEGTYGDYWVNQRPVTLVGRCAARTIVVGNRTMGALQSTAQDVVVRGVTFRNHRDPIQALRGGSVVVEDVVVERVVFAAITALEGGHLEVRRSLVRDLVEDRGYGTALNVYEGSSAIVEDVTLERVAQSGLDVAGAGSAATARRLVVRDVVPAGPSLATGILVRDGAALDAQTIVVERFGGNGVAVLGPSRLRLEGSVVRDIDHLPARETANGVAAFQDAEVDLVGTTITGVQGIGARVLAGATLRLASSAVVGMRPHATNGDLGVGAYAHAGGRLEAADTAFVGNHRTAVEAHDAGTSAALARVLVAGTRSAPGDRNGGGVLAASGASLDLEDGAVVGNLQHGVHAQRAGAVSLRRTTLRRTGVEAFGARLGHGVLAVDSADVRLVQVELAGNASAGVAAIGGGMLVLDSWIRGNAVGVHVDGPTRLVEVPVSQRDVAPTTLAIGRDVRFVDNGSRTGAGSIPVPEPVAPVAPVAP